MSTETCQVEVDGKEKVVSELRRIGSMKRQCTVRGQGRRVQSASSGHLSLRFLLLSRLKRRKSQGSRSRDEAIDRAGKIINDDDGRRAGAAGMPLTGLGKGT